MPTGDTWLNCMECSIHHFWRENSTTVALDKAMWIFLELYKRKICMKIWKSRIKFCFSFVEFLNIPINNKYPDSSKKATKPRKNLLWIVTIDLFESILRENQISIKASTYLRYQVKTICIAILYWLQSLLEIKISYTVGWCNILCLFKAQSSF